MFRSFAIISWAILIFYYATFQIIAVRLHPKLLIDSNPNKIEEFLNSPIGRFRDLMKLLWINNSIILIILFLISFGFTITWLSLKRLKNNNESNLVQR